MAQLAIFKDSFPADATDAQKQLTVAFGTALLTLARMAARDLGIGDAGGSGKFGLKMMERFESDSPKPHRFYRASVGSSVERNVYRSLLMGMGASRTVSGEDMMDAMEEGDVRYSGCYAGQLPPSTDIVFALEFTASAGQAFPCSFKSSRPDIRLSLGASTNGTQYEALFDLTSEKQKGHVLKKRDKWINKGNVPFIAEVVWEDSDIMLK